jgi:hypothetical protein
MKKFFALILTGCLLCSNALAGELKSETYSNINSFLNSEKFAEYLMDWIPGEGTTEFSFDLRENTSPGFSILAVRELSKTSSGNYFTQLSASAKDSGVNNDYHGNQDARMILNAGFGKRILLNDNTVMLGINNFYDYDVWMSHSRIGFGAEVKSAVVDFNANYYQNINSGGNAEHVMNGYDYQVKTQVPYIHWANVFANSYKWYGKDRDDVEGLKLGGEAQLSSTFSVLSAWDDKDTSGVTDEWYSKLIFNWPPRDAVATAADGISNIAWRENKDVSDKLLDKVDRVNNIMIEFKGSATISRTD